MPGVQFNKAYLLLKFSSLSKRKNQVLDALEKREILIGGHVQISEDLEMISNDLLNFGLTEAMNKDRVCT